MYKQIQICSSARLGLILSRLIPFLTLGRNSIRQRGPLRRIYDNLRICILVEIPGCKYEFIGWRNSTGRPTRLRFGFEFGGGRERHEDACKLMFGRYDCEIGDASTGALAEPVARGA